MVGLTMLFAEAVGLESTVAPVILLPWRKCKRQLKQIGNLATAMPDQSLAQRIVELHASWVTLVFNFSHDNKSTFLSSLKRGTVQSPAARVMGIGPEQICDP